MPKWSQHCRLAGPAPHLALELGHLPALAVAAGTQQAESRLRHGRELVGRRAAFELVLAVTQEGEVVVGQPVDERGGLASLRIGDARQPLAHVVGDRTGLRDHLRPVRDRHAHVVERRRDAPAQALELFSVAGAVDLDVLPGLCRTPLGLPGHRLDAAAPVAHHAEHWVHHRVDRKPGAVQHHGERVDQERHVVSHDFDDGARRIPAVARRGRIEDPHQCLPRLARGPESQVPRGGSRQRRGFSRAQVGLVDTAVVIPDERRERCGCTARAARLLRNGVDEVLACGGNGSWHDSFPVGLWWPARIIGQVRWRAGCDGCRNATRASVVRPAPPCRP